MDGSSRGRVVIPAQTRERLGLIEGTALVLLETPGGLVLLTRDQLRARVRNELQGLDLVGDLLLSYEPTIEPVGVTGAEWAARGPKRGEELSFADRLCLALAERVDGQVLAADAVWGTSGPIDQIR
ncbi:MAG: hypothetical protein GY720_15105 [bacterium]|nr:hypothetical protein [bacterium]